ncbi:MAG: UDP-N-acetylmuramoyl-tripeptide--D-alanyl-D-alanine ligase [Chlamydiales bacterium]
MKPLPLKAIAHLLGKSDTTRTLVQGVAIDSRQVKKGDLFFALPGERVDGHCFIEEAALKGAAGVVVKEGYKGACFGLPKLFVSDVLPALQMLARKSLAKRSSKVVAITGSLGKTTTKDFATTLLSGSFHLFASPKSYNSQVTVPLSILMADETEDILVLEMAMSEPGQIARLVSIAPPDIAILTTVSLQHVCHFPGGLIDIAREKAAIFSHPKTGLGILNRDMPYFEEILSTGNNRKLCYSLSSSKADFFLEVKTNGATIHTKEGASLDFSLQLPMKAFYQNFLAAAVLAKTMGVSWEVIQKRAAHLKLPPQRFERVERGGIIFINDAYNANPDAMKAALESLPKPQPGGKTIAVLGDMNALGEHSKEGHATVAEAALSYVDLLFCLGSRWEGTQAKMLFGTRTELENMLKKTARPGDIVLLKGARQHALEELLEKF